MRRLFQMIPMLFTIVIVAGCPDGDLEFQLIRTLSGSKGSFSGLDCPIGIAYRRTYDLLNCDLFILDKNMNKVIFLNSIDDSVVLDFGELGTQEGQFSSPKGITVTRCIESLDYPLPEEIFIYVADTKNHRIQKFDSNGNFITMWGSFGTENGEFNTPTGIDIDFEGNIFVADSGNNRVQVFTENGDFINAWGELGSENYQFKGPTNIAIGFKDISPENQFDFIAVSDPGNNRVQLFNKDGEFLRSYKNMPDIAGMNVIYSAKWPGRWLAVICGTNKDICLINETNAKILDINEMAGPYGIYNCFITDTANHNISIYGWSRH